MWARTKLDLLTKMHDLKSQSGIKTVQTRVCKYEKWVQLVNHSWKMLLNAGGTVVKGPTDQQQTSEILSFNLKEKKQFMSRSKRNTLVQ